MSATAFDAEPTELTQSSTGINPDSSPPVRLARLRVRHWFWWLVAPVALLVATAVLRLDRNFVAVGLLFAALILIQLVFAWSDLQMTRRREASKLDRKPCRRPSHAR
jgi:hypothetical protein